MKKYQPIDNYRELEDKLINKININKKETDFGKSKKLTNVSQPATAAK